MVRIAIVGMGWAGQRHVQAIRELGHGLDIVCLVDSDEEHLARVAHELNLSSTTSSYQAVLDDVNVDAVSICTPHALHCSMAIAAAEAGKHVLVEKPMALSVADATHMINAANANGVKLYVAESASYTPMANFLHHVVRSREPIGELTAAVVQGGFRAPNFGYPGRRSWLTRPEAGGTGTWMLHGIHTVAQMRFVFGEFETVYMREHKASSFLRTDLEGTMAGLLTLRSGVAVMLIQTCETKFHGNLGGYTLHGERGSVCASARGYRIYDEQLRGKEGERRPYPQSALSEYALEMKAFINTLSGIETGPTTGDSERRSLAVVQAGYESVATGQSVNLRERFGELHDR